MSVILPALHDAAFFDFLLKTETIGKEAAAAVAKEAQKEGKSKTNVTLSMGLVTERQAAELIAREYGAPFLELAPPKTPEDRPLKESLSLQQIMRTRIIPFARDGASVSAAAADPFALEQAKRQIAAAKQAALTTHPDALPQESAGGPDYSKYDFTLYVTTLSHFDAYLQAASERNRQATPDALKIPSPREALMNSLARDAGRPGTPKKHVFTSGTDIIAYVNEVIKGAAARGASDVHIEKFEKNARVRYRVDGALREITDHNDFLNKHYSSIVTRVKILASLDISEKRLPQDGGIAFEADGLKTDIRVSTLPAAHGERVVMRIIDQKASQFRIDDLGLEPEALKLLKKSAFAPQGMILVTGPTGSGKSTTLYAVLKERNTEDVNILTAEDPVEFNLEGVGQVRVREDIGLSFSTALRSFLRQDPEIIMVGEIRDKETCDIAVKASLTGHLVLSTLHTNDALGTVTRLINMGTPPFLITSSVTLIVAQRLVRSNCKHCPVPDEDDPRERLLACGFLPQEIEGAAPMKGAGCDVCEGTGVKGRVAAHEALAMTPDLKKGILEGRTEPELKEIAKSGGFLTLQDAALRHIKRGRISIKEFQRTIMTE